MCPRSQSVCRTRSSSWLQTCLLATPDSAGPRSTTSSRTTRTPSGLYDGWGGGGASRWQLFESGLYSLSLDDQRRFLLELCTYDGYSKYPMPSDEDIAALRALLLADTSPGATAASSHLSKLDD